MKKTLILISFLGFSLFFAQTTEKDTQTSQASEKYTNVVETLPEFPGGINVFRKSISAKFKMSILTSLKETAKSETNFLIDADGNLGSVTTVGNNKDVNKEMTRVIKSIKPKWKPATYKGQPVQYWFKLPMTFN